MAFACTQKQSFKPTACKSAGVTGDCDFHQFLSPWTAGHDVTFSVAMWLMRTRERSQWPVSTSVMSKLPKYNSVRVSVVSDGTPTDCSLTIWCILHTKLAGTFFICQSLIWLIWLVLYTFVSSLGNNGVFKSDQECVSCTTMQLAD